MKRWILNLSNLFSGHMGIHTLLYLLFLVCLSSYASAEDCPISHCGNDSFPIRLPFWLEGQQPQSCGYPGFKIRCSPQGKTILNLPFSGDFYVLSIFYYVRRIQLYDPNGCLAQRLLSFNLSSSPFSAIYYENYTFLTCPGKDLNLMFAVDCLSNSTTTVLATKNPPTRTACKNTDTIAIPLSSKYDLGFPVNLELTWNVSICSDCASPPATDHSTSEDPAVHGIIALALVIPVLIVCVSYTICIVRRHTDILQTGDTNQTSTSAGTIQQSTRGLDNSTIESYKKIILDESRHLPGHNGITCHICLVDYSPKDAVRCIPECEHCFHADCIDKWLRINRNCPICRTSTLL